MTRSKRYSQEHVREIGGLWQRQHPGHFCEMGMDHDGSSSLRHIWVHIYMDYVGQNQEFVGIQWDWVRMMWINQISKERWTSRSPSYFGGGHSYMENRRAGGHDETPVIQLADWTCQKLPFWLLASRVFRFGMAWDQPFQIFIHW